MMSPEKLLSNELTNERVNELKKKAKKYGKSLHMSKICRTFAAEIEKKSL